ncbi:MAG: hypothetical protein VW146_02475 [Gammaproteobacteria bacterium]
MSIWRIINPFVVLILRSPFHSIASKNLLFISFKGRKTQKKYHIPVSYHKEGRELIALTLKKNLWWKNLVSLTHVQITLQGKAQDAAISIVIEDTQYIKEKMRKLIISKPIDAFFAKVRLDANKHPIEDDLHQAAQKHIVLRFNLIP